MVARHRYCVVLVLGSLGPGSLGWALPPCGPPGTITTVTAPDGGDYIAAFSDYKIYPPEPLSFLEGVVDLVAEPDYRSYYPQNLALGPRGRVHVADMTIIYRLEDDGTATRIVGVPQYSARETDADGWREPLLQQTNVLQDTVAALEARIAPGRWPSTGKAGSTSSTMSIAEGNLRTEARIARLEADGQVTTFAALESGPFFSLLFDPGGHLLVGGRGGIQRIDAQGVVSWLRVVSWAGPCGWMLRGDCTSPTVEKSIAFLTTAPLRSSPDRTGATRTTALSATPRSMPPMAGRPPKRLSASSTSTSMPGRAVSRKTTGTAAFTAWAPTEFSKRSRGTGGIIHTSAAVLRWETGGDGKAAVPAHVVETRWATAVRPWTPRSGNPFSCYFRRRTISSSRCGLRAVSGVVRRHVFLPAPHL